MTARASFKLLLQYDGRRFHGWQTQPGLRTVQGDLEEALRGIFGQPLRVHGAGRTDAGVHAVGQVAHVHAPARHVPLTLRRALNAKLLGDVWIADVRRVSPRFHARFDAVARTYRYVLGTEDLARSPFHRPYCWPVGGPLDGERLGQAAAELPGRHDFSGFSRSGPGSRLCAVRSAEWVPDPLGWRFEITADRFLRGMVRGLVGACVEVARGSLPREWMVERLRTPDCGRSPGAAPPEGLFLWRVDYPASPAPAGALGVPVATPEA